MSQSRVSPTFVLITISLISASCLSVTSADEAVSPGVDARSWLINNENPSAFAVNRFSSTEDALKFVDMLSTIGAVDVLITGIYDEEWRIESNGGPYADTFIIVLPSEPQSRKAIFEIASHETQEEGFIPEQDHGQGELRLWWD